MSKYIILFGIFAGISGCAFMDKVIDDYPHDNVVENYIEDVIENEIALKIDLSPSSPEDEDRW